MFSSISVPFSIRLFLAEGSATGLTVATIPNWAGSILRCRNASLPSLLARQEAQRPGVYVLQGPDPTLSDDQGGIAAYIGQGGRIGDRLPQSAGERAFWEMAVIVTTSDPNFSAAHFLALEAMMIREARIADRVRLDNGTSPADTAGALGEADRADIESFFEQVKQVLPILGLDLLRPQPRVGVAIPPHTAAADPNSGRQPDPFVADTAEFVLQRKEGMLARARDLDGEFVVLKGSEALKDTEFASNSYSRLRDKLIADGVLTTIEGDRFFTFERDTPFQSPSAAAAVVLNRTSNGRTEWKVSGNGQTYNDWQARSASSRDNQGTPPDE
jgi:hypothetical protein